MPSEPVAWSAHIYGLAAGDGLAVCVRHRGRHRFYLDACHALPPGLSRAARLALTEQDRPAPAAAPVQVELDEHRLAAGIALALDALTERRRRENSQPARAPAPGGAPPVASSSILDSYRE